MGKLTDRFFWTVSSFRSKLKTLELARIFNPCSLCADVGKKPVRFFPLGELVWLKSYTKYQRFGKRKIKTAHTDFVSDPVANKIYPPAGVELVLASFLINLFELH